MGSDIYIMALVCNISELSKASLITKEIFSALLSYTSFLNLSREINYIWKKPLKPPTLFYILTRYATIIYLAMTLAEILFTDDVVS